MSLLRRNHDFGALFFAQAASLMGDSFATVALLGLVLDATGSPLAATGIFVSGSLPALLLRPLAGPLADRFDRQRLMCSSLQCRW